MSINLIAFALLSVAQTPATSSEMVQILYREACDFGQIRLDPSTAIVVKNGPLPSIVAPPYGGKAEKVTVIRLRHLPSTYLLIAEYNPTRRQGVARVCRVFSKAITFKDAERAFLADVEKPKVWRDLNPARAYTPYEIDRRKEGFRKRLHYRDPWVILETAIYKEPH